MRDLCMLKRMWCWFQCVAEALVHVEGIDSEVVTK